MNAKPWGDLAQAAAMPAPAVPPTPDDEPPTYALLADLLARPELLKPPECVVPRLAYRGRLVLLAGPDKSGKSTLLSHATAALTREAPFLGGAVGARSGRVIWMGLEEAVGDAVRRLAELEADPDRVQLVVCAPRDLLDQTRALLAEWPADLLVIDSLTEYARIAYGAIPDDGDNAGWAAVLRPLVGVAREHDVAVVVLHHVRRSDGQFRGAGEIAAAADALLELVPPTSGEDQTMRRIRGRGRWTVEPFAVALREGRYELAGGSELSVDVRVLLHIEANPGTSKAATRKAVGGRATVVDAAINRLLERGAIEDSANGRRGLWPASGQQEMGVDG
jgi:energy-coupling factor transporter ATP-binding protein EcfA2